MYLYFRFKVIFCICKATRELCSDDWDGKGTFAFHSPDIAVCKTGCSLCHDRLLCTSPVACSLSTLAHEHIHQQQKGMVCSTLLPMSRSRLVHTVGACLNDQSAACLNALCLLSIVQENTVLTTQIKGLHTSGWKPNLPNHGYASNRMKSPNLVRYIRAQILVTTTRIRRSPKRLTM